LKNILLPDYQFWEVKVVTREFKKNVVGLAKTANIFDFPLIITTGVDWGPNGFFYLN
jgi:hypothetical protein